jgi:hypothetical protein
MTQQVSAVAGTTYSMSFYSGTHTPSVSPKVEIRFYNSSNTEIGTASVHTITTDIDNTNNLGGPYVLNATAPAGVSYMKVIMRDPSTSHAGSKADSFCLVASTTAGCNVSADGTYIDAESPSAIINASATYGFDGVRSSTAGFVGTGYLASESSPQNQQAFSHVNSNPGEYTRYDYALNFANTGVYSLWTRGYAADGTSDSIFVGLDGAAVGSLHEGGVYGQWVWTSAIQEGSNQINVTTAGVHTISIWRREAGHLLDGFYLTQTIGIPTGGIPIGVPVVLACH